MAKKIKSKKSNRLVNIYDTAGLLETMNTESANTFNNAFKGENIGSTIGGLTSGLSGMVGSSLSYFKQDDSDVESALKRLENAKVDSWSNSDLLNEMSNFSAIDEFEKKDFAPSAGQTVGNIFTSMGSGATMGASIGGPWGAVAGAGAGLIKGGIEAIVANANAKKKTEEYNIRRKNAIENAMNNFSARADAIEDLTNSKLASQYFADGGFTSVHGIDFTNGITKINNGGTHEQNPFEGVPMGMDNEGIPNLVEEGEVKYDNYIFSNRLKANKKLLSTYSLPEKYEEKSFADIAKILSKESEERPNDPISKRGLEDSMSKLQQAQEEVRMKKEIKKGKNSFAKGGKLGRLYSGDGSDSQVLHVSPEDPLFSFADASLFDMYSLDHNGTMAPYLVDPLTGNVTQKVVSPIETPTVYKGVVETTTGKTPSELVSEEFKKSSKSNKSNKNTSNWESWLRYAPVLGSALGLGLAHIKDKNPASDRLGEIAQSLRDVDYTPIGNYLTYNPLDRNYYINRKNAEAAATRNALMQSNSPSRNAALLAADYNNQIALGELYRQAEEYNLNQRKAVEEFNRGTNTFNSEMALKAAMANQAQDKNRADLLTKQVVMEAEDKLNREKAISANATSLFDSIGDIGREAVFRQMIASDPSKLYDVLRDGTVVYRGKKDGGYLTIKKRRR